MFFDDNFEGICAQNLLAVSISHLPEINPFEITLITVLAPIKAADTIQKLFFEPQDYHIKNA